MGIYVKDGAGNVKKLAGYITQRFNTRWFLCKRSIEDDVEYYDVPDEALDYFQSINAYTLYCFGFDTPNTTTNPKLRFAGKEFGIYDFNAIGDTPVVVNQLTGAFEFFTQDLTTDPKMYFASTLNIRNITLDYNTMFNIPVLDTTSETALDATSEDIKGTISLHKVSKTGKLADIIEDETHQSITVTAKTQIETNKENIGKLNTDLSGLNTRVTTNEKNIATNTTNIETNKTLIENLDKRISPLATENNPAMDRDFINSSINNVAAYYITKNADGDPFNTKAELTAATTFYSGGQERVPTRNDYCTILSDESQMADDLGRYPTTRYTYQGSQWELSFIVNNTTFTAAQLATLNSGITETLTKQITTNKNDIPVAKAEAKAEAIEVATALQIELGCNGIMEVGNITFTVQDYEDYLPHRKNLKEFILTLLLPVTGEVDANLPINITFGDTTYYVYNRFTKERLKWGELVNATTTTPSGFQAQTTATLYITSDVIGFYADPHFGDLRYDKTQNLTNEQKAQARSNIGAGASSFSGFYNDLGGLPALNTDNSVSLDISSDETIKDTISLHKISKTGKLADAITDAEHTSVTVAEKSQITTNKNNIAINAGEIDTNRTNITTNAINIETNRKNIAANSSNISSLSDRMGSAEGNISTNTNQITSLTSRVGTNEDNIAIAESDIESLQTDLGALAEKISPQATKDNPAMDKNFINSTINSLAAYYITKNADGDPFNTKAELTAATTFYSGGVVRIPTRNDYCTVLNDESQSKDELGHYPTTRYTYQGSQWELSFSINNTTFTAAQLAALNSNITAEQTKQIGINTTNITTNTGNITKAQTTADNAMPKAGGTFTGPVSWSDNGSALPSKATPEYFLTIESFASGGKTYYTSQANTKSALGVTALETMLGETQKDIQTKDGQNVKLTGNQTIQGTKNFNGTFQIGGATIKYDSATQTFIF